MNIKFVSVVIFISALIIQGCSSRDKTKIKDDSASNGSSSNSSSGAFTEPLQQAFRAEIQAVLDSQDPQGLGLLYHAEGVDQEIAELGLSLAKSSLFDNIVMQFQFIAAGDNYEKFAADYRYTPNLEVVGEVQFQFDESANFTSSTQIPYGLTDGQYRFVLPNRELIEYDGPRNTQIGFSTLGFVIDGEATLSIKVAYTVSGYQRVIETVVSGGLSSTFWGQHIDSVSLEIISGEGELWFSVSENGEIIYESAEGTGGDLLTYFREE